MSICASPMALDQFLACDFARFNSSLIDRCGQMDGRRLYLSGATGFFGMNLLALLAHLQRRGASFKVTVLSRAPHRFLHGHSWSRNLKWLEWLQGDASEPWPGDGEHDLMIHAATETSAAAHDEKLGLFQQISLGTMRALEFSASHGVQRLLLTGSGAQYGVIPGTFANGIPESSPLACDSTKTRCAYGEAKRVGEMLAALYGEKYAISIINTRCFAFVGPGLPLTGHYAIGNFLNDALSGKSIRLATSGNALRSYLYSADLAVWLLILLLEASPGALVNVGSDTAFRIRDVADRVRNLVNPEVDVSVGPASPEEERHIYVPSIAYARTLGLDVWTGIDEAIARTAEWNRQVTP